MSERVTWWTKRAKDKTEAGIKSPAQQFLNSHSPSFLFFSLLFPSFPILFSCRSFFPSFSCPSLLASPRFPSPPFIFRRFASFHFPFLFPSRSRSRTGSPRAGLPRVRERASLPAVPERGLGRAGLPQVRADGAGDGAVFVQEVGPQAHEAGRRHDRSHPRGGLYGGRGG